MHLPTQAAHGKPAVRSDLSPCRAATCCRLFGATVIGKVPPNGTGTTTRAQSSSVPDLAQPQPPHRLTSPAASSDSCNASVCWQTGSRSRPPRTPQQATFGRGISSPPPRTVYSQAFYRRPSDFMARIEEVLREQTQHGALTRRDRGQSSTSPLRLVPALRRLQQTSAPPRQSAPLRTARDRPLHPSPRSRSRTRARSSGRCRLNQRRTNQSEDPPGCRAPAKASRSRSTGREKPIRPRRGPRSCPGAHEQLRAQQGKPAADSSYTYYSDTATETERAQTVSPLASQAQPNADPHNLEAGALMSRLLQLPEPDSAPQSARRYPSRRPPPASTTTPLPCPGLNHTGNNSARPVFWSATVRTCDMAICEGDNRALHLARKTVPVSASSDGVSAVCLPLRIYLLALSIKAHRVIRYLRWPQLSFILAAS